MTKQNPTAPTVSSDPFSENNPRYHALVLEEKFEFIWSGISTLFLFAAEGQEEAADQYGVNFVARSMDHTAQEMRKHFDELKRTLGIRRTS
jgi:hypothetical protein